MSMIRDNSFVVFSIHPSIGTNLHTGETSNVWTIKKCWIYSVVHSIVGFTILQPSNDNHCDVEFDQCLFWWIAINHKLHVIKRKFYEHQLATGHYYRADQLFIAPSKNSSTWAQALTMDGCAIYHFHSIKW